MGFLKTTTLFVTFIAFLSSFQQTNAQNTPQDFVAAHNSIRTPLGLPPVRWNTTVEAFAKSYAAIRAVDCELVHSDALLGENLVETGNGHLTAAESVKLWADEAQFYDYKTNTCVQGEECGHYTQLIWRDSVNIGCATVKCQNKDWIFVTCNYYPYGNVDGERPY